MKIADAVRPYILVAQRCRDFVRDDPRADAVVVADGRVTAVSNHRRLLRTRQRGTRVIDLGACVITPGLVDSHTHFFSWALWRALTIDVSMLTNLDAVLRRIHRLSRSRRVGNWVIARGFDHNRWSTSFPTSADLDRAVADHPTIVRSRDGHSAWLNSAALRLLSINGNTPDPVGGRFLRDQHGQPTGIVQEAALDQLPDPLREFSRRTDSAALRTIDRALDAAYRDTWELGIVGVHCMDDGPSLYHLTRHRTAERLGLRALHAIPLQDLDHVDALGLRRGLGDDWLRLGGVKIFADGALGSQTAHMFDSYPGRDGYCGVPVLLERELTDAVRRATRLGWPVWIHAIGDRAVHDAIRAIATAPRPDRSAPPHRIEHAQCVRAADIRRLARLGIVASVQPCHLLGDIPTADRHWPIARRHAYPLRALLDAGAILAAGSDVPIESIDPRRSLFAATMRTDEHGHPAGGWFPSQRLTTAEVLHAFTRGAAAAAGLPLPAGTLAPGALADMTIWHEDPLDVPPPELLEIGIAGCVIGGAMHLSHA